MNTFERSSNAKSGANVKTESETGDVENYEINNACFVRDFIIKGIKFKIWVELSRDFCPLGDINWPPGRNEFVVWKADSRFFSGDDRRFALSIDTRLLTIFEKKRTLLQSKRSLYPLTFFRSLSFRFMS